MNMAFEKKRRLMTQDNTVFPDIIVHRRGDIIDNLLVLEVKKFSNTHNAAQSKDKIKLRLYVEQLHYRFGAFCFSGRELNLQIVSNGLSNGCLLYKRQPASPALCGGVCP